MIACSIPLIAVSSCVGAFLGVLGIALAQIGRGR